MNATYQSRSAARTGESERVSARQRQVLSLVSQGLTNKEIATSLRIAVPTVNQHIRSLLLRFGASNRTKLAVLARASFSDRA
jgi:NarL family two-component system response regulator LiaR